MKDLIRHEMFITIKSYVYNFEYDYKHVVVSDFHQTILEKCDVLFSH